MLFLPLIWRWSQLLLAIIIMVVEYVLRGILGTVFKFIPLKYLSSLGLLPNYSSTSSPLSEDDKDLERSTPEIIRSRGFKCEEHHTTTPDGFVLGLHRIPFGLDSIDGAEENSIDDKTPNQRAEIRPAVLILHGFMQSSEAFVCRKDPHNSLPMVLANAGFDVWLGNNRGNKYSYKHIRHSPQDEEFWNWSLDEIVRYDVPSMIEYVLSRNRGQGLILIGFSQGTAQSWAALSSNAYVASKVKLFIGLAPVATVRGFSNPLIDSIARTRPDFISLLFGKKAFLPVTLFWRKILPRDQFVNVLDYSVNFLFGWKGEGISPDEKKLLYSHIYSYSSVKAVVHWFQIIQTGRFQMFDQSMLEGTNAHVIPSYQPSLVTCPIALYFGGQDFLPNTNALIESLPKDLLLEVHRLPDYEHLDFLYAKDVGVKVYPRIVRMLEQAQKKGIQIL